MNKEFIPYKQALELKELGFDEPFNPFDTFYYRNGHLCEANKDAVEYFNSFNDEVVLAPLYQQAFRWFREKYGLASQFAYYHVPKWTFEILEFTDIKMTPSKIVVEYSKPRTYEEAELECLKKLIKIVNTLTIDWKK